MDKPERKAREVSREAERRVVEHRERTEAARADKQRRHQERVRSDSPQSLVEKKSIIAPTGEKKLNEFMIKTSPKAFERVSKLSGKPLTPEEKQKLQESNKRLEPKKERIREAIKKNVLSKAEGS